MELTSGQLNGSMSSLSLVTVPITIEENHGPSGISKEIDVAFVLRNILEVPEVQLDGYLKHLGDPLEGWNMDLCGNCDGMVIKAKQIYQEMVEAKRRFKEVKFEIISKIMSIQQGIKCEDKEPDVNPEENEFQDGTSSGGDFPQIANVYSVDELMIEGRVQDDELEVNQINQADRNQVFDLDQVQSDPQDSSRLHQERTLSKKKKRKLTKTRSSLFHQYRQLAVSKNPALHGLVIKDHHKKLPEYGDGPVQCKCGKQFSRFVNLCRHVKEVYEEPFRCEICFEAQPSTLVTFKRKDALNRHVQTVHQGKLQQGIKFGDNEAEVESKTIESSEKEETKELSPPEDENMLEFEYHFKTERPLPLSEVIGFAEEPEEPDNETVPDHEAASSKNRKTMSSKFRQLALSKDSNALHGLVIMDQKKVPGASDGPVQCKCGKVYGKFAKLIIHVKEIYEEPVRCEICFQSQPSKLMNFTRKDALKRHIETMHQGKLSPCPECGTRMRSDLIKAHLQSCQKK